MDSVRRSRRLAAVLGTLLLATLSACRTASPSTAPGGHGPAASTASGTAHAPDPARVPGVGRRLYARIPARSRQVVAVYGKSRDSAESEVVLYVRQGGGWHREGSWAAHNGRRGWTFDHHEDDKRSPVGVFTLSDAGGTFADPGSKLPYDHNTYAYASPKAWPKAYQHDFGYVIAIDYNRVPGTPPRDAARPWGADKGGGIWLHLDHGSGTSACVSMPKSAMETLLRTLDPARHPVVVMGDRADLGA
ncbi:L,D-transpeptidase family protein [Streptomyces malaysiense]|uniref:L,D-TPase catalytic domain-containing protein n=1 Tax=Streptomyces malaysiense TaxID=1428626 RepID=A0A1J4PR82_9ACTN|nr:L,D-transpeptidase family protein [Streptomyces malaysiense]OIK23242.1 hypothetical protein VT52_033255 [Streptomyces malaysiense]